METNAHILVVDDNPHNLKLLGKILSEEGFQIGIAQNGVEALKSANILLPDLVLLDVMMPEMDGLETCQEFKKSERLKDIPIIFLTAKTEAESVISGFQLGAVDYVTKPFNSHELLARVKTHLELKFGRETIAQQRNELRETIHILCHDLANPLSCLVTYLKMADRNPDILIKRKNSLLASALQGVEIIQLVSKIREFEEGKTHLDLAIVHVKEAFEKSLETLEPQFTQKQIKPVLNIDNDIIVLAEKTSLVNSVFNNLLTNALKFSHPQSQIIIEARNENDQVLVTIKDFGIGIPSQMLKDIFHSDKITTRLGTAGEKGTGFGMPLVKKFITAYGGSIEVSSQTEGNDDPGTEVKLIFRNS